MTPGQSYVGKRAFTVTGIPCQRWDQQLPHKHMYNDDNFPDDGSIQQANNYCRYVTGITTLPIIVITIYMWKSNAGVLGCLATSRRCEFPPRLVAGLAVTRNIRQFVSGAWRERM